MQWIVFGLMLVSSSLCWAGEIRGQLKWANTDQQEDFRQIPVRVDIYQNTRQQGTAEADVNAKGEFVFHQLSTEQDIFYLVYVAYQSVSYFAGPAKFSAGQDLLDVGPIVLYPATALTSNLSTQEVITLEPVDDYLLRITHDINMTNAGTTVYAPDTQDAQLVNVPLMRGGYALDFLQGLSPRMINLGPEGTFFTINKPIFPTQAGPEHYRIQYIYPYRQHDVTFDLPMSVARRRIDVIVKNNKWTVTSKVMQRLPGIPGQNRDWQTFSAINVPAHSPLALSIAGFVLKKDFERRGLLAGLVVVLTMLGGLTWWLGRGTRLRSDQQTWQQLIMDDLLALERSKRTGQIQDRHYQAERRRLREWLFACTNPRKYGPDEG